jgi:hypothetical protein
MIRIYLPNLECAGSSHVITSHVYCSMVDAGLSTLMKAFTCVSFARSLRADKQDGLCLTLADPFTSQGQHEGYDFLTMVELGHAM